MFLNSQQNNLNRYSLINYLISSRFELKISIKEFNKMILMNLKYFINIQIYQKYYHVF